MEGFRLNKVLKYDFEKIQGSSYSDSKNPEADKKKRRKKAVKKLASSITVMVDRVHSLNDEVPDFEKFLESKPESAEPKDVFREWKEIVENLIREKL